MEVKSNIETAVPPSVEPKSSGLNDLVKRSLSRKELTRLANWGFRLFLIILSIYLVSQGAKWVSAFVFGCGFAAVGIGVYLTFRVLNFPDLTIEGSYTLGAAVALNLISNNNGTDPTTGAVLGNALLGNPWVATGLATVCGGLAGLTTGLLHTRLKINGLLASILVTTGLYSINLHVLAPTAIINIGDKPNVTNTFIGLYQSTFHPDRLDSIAKEWLRFGFFALVALVLIGLFNWFLNTQWGLALRATGDNENMIRALGVNTDRSKLTLLVLSNALYGLAGAMLAQYLGYADNLFGLGMVVIGLAAVILGESFIAPVTTLTALVGALVGAIIYRLLFTGVFGLEISWGLAIHALLTLAIAAILAYLVFLTVNSQTPALLSLLCLVLAGAIGAVLSTWLDYTVHSALGNDIDKNLIFKAAEYDIRLVLSVLIVVAMGVPALRSRIGTRVLQAATGR